MPDQKLDNLLNLAQMCIRDRNMNLLFGFPEAEGLQQIPMFP